MLRTFEKVIETLIFWSRWLQAPLYAGLIIGGVLYAYKFTVELYHMVVDINVITESQLMLGVLTLVDITMVANLLIMVIIGGYSTFVSKMDIEHHEDREESGCRYIESKTCRFIGRCFRYSPFTDIYQY
jgi:uncharacterized protein (TIGR00645 family)